MSSTADKTEEFLRLFAACQRRIHGLVVAMVPHTADAEDVFQTVSTSLWQKFDEFQPGTDFAAWALRFTRYAVLKHYEKLRRRGNLVFDEQLLDTLADDATRAVRQIDRRQEALHGCLKRLPEHARTLLRMRYESGLKSCREVAERLGRSVEGVYKALGRIHEQLLRCIRGALSAEERS